MSYWQVHKPMSIHSPSMHFCFNGLKRSLITAGERPIVLPHPFPGLTCQEGRAMQLWEQRAGWKGHTFLQNTLSVAGLGMWTFSSCNLAYISWEDLERIYVDLNLAMLGSYECRMKGYCDKLNGSVLRFSLPFALIDIYFGFLHFLFTTPPLLFLYYYSFVNPINVFLTLCNLLSLVILLSQAFSLLFFPSVFHGFYVLGFPSTYNIWTRGSEKYLRYVLEVKDTRLWQAGTKESRLTEKKKKMLVKEEAGYRNFLYQRKGRSWWEQ